MRIFDISEYFILGCTRELNVNNIYYTSAQVLTVATAVLIVIGILNQSWYNFRFYKYEPHSTCILISLYRYYLLAYVLNNCLDSVVYQFTLVVKITFSM